MARRILTVCAVVFAALTMLAGPASAHAELVASTPSQGAVVNSEPTQIALRFSEEIVLRLSAVKVIGPDGRRLDTGTLHAGPFRAESMAIDLAPDAQHGSFVVVWQATAADDGHSTSGTVMFSVGARSAVASVAELGHNRLTSAVYDAGQWLGFAGLAMVGGVAALHTKRRQEQEQEHNQNPDQNQYRDQAQAQEQVPTAPETPETPETPAAPAAPAAAAAAAAARVAVAAVAPEAPAAPSLANPTWPAALGWSLLLIGTLIQVTAYAPAARGLPLTHLLDRSLLSVTLATREGHAFMARLAFLAVAAVIGDAVLRRARNAWLPSLFTLAVAATWGATGHAATGGGTGFAMVSLTVHVAAMAVWVGGLFVVAVLLAGKGDAVGAVVRRFSRLALVAVAALAATGLYQAWRELGSISALTDTGYGRLVIAKAAILLCVVAVARGSRGIAATWRGESAAALRRNVMLELAGASMLLVLAVLLAGSAPGK